MEAVPFWGGVRKAVSQAGGGGAGLWTWLKEKVDLAQYRPEAAPGVLARQLAGREGQYFVLKNQDTKTYYRLGERDHFLWQLMDGTRTVKDLVVAYFLQYGSFAFARIAALVEGLKANLFLKEQPVYVYRQVRGQLQRRKAVYRLAQLQQLFVEKQFAINGLDRFLGSVYRWGGRLLFSRPLLFLYLVASVIGLYCFACALRVGDYGLVTIAGSYGLGIAGLIVANLAAIFLHEMAHALTVKHYGREVRRGGFMIYFGTPAFFIDTTDIWLEGKGARLAVTWAGPYSGLVLGGLASMVIILWPAFSLNPLLFQFAFLSYLTVFLNLNPLLELDGYFLLMDWVEIPMLRDRSLEFIRTGLRQRWGEIRQVGTKLKNVLASFSREERIFAIFGLLSAGWTAYAILAGAYFWQVQLAGALRDLWVHGGDVRKIILSLGVVAISLPFVVSIGLYLLGLARRVLDWAARQGLFANTWSVAATLLVIAVLLAGASSYLGYPALVPVISLAALAVGILFAWREAVYYAGSRSAMVFWLLGGCLLALFSGEAANVAATWPILGALAATSLAKVVRLLGYICVLLACLHLFADTDLRGLGLVEKVLLALGLLASYVLVFWVATRQELQPPTAEALLTIIGPLFSLLALTMLMPTLFSFWRTRFGPAWLAFSLALGGLGAMTLLGLPPVLSHLLLAASFVLHHLAHAQAPLPQRQLQVALDLSDQRRLQQAFAWTVSSIVAQLHETVGERHAGALLRTLNSYAFAAGWHLSTGKSQVDDSLSFDLSLGERGKVYAAALTLLLDLVAQQVGEKLTVRTLQWAYDGLPWEDREVAVQHLFRDVERAKVLSREFRAVHQDYRSLLRCMPLFATMDEAEINLLCSQLKLEHYSPGQAIIRQGERGDKFYLIRRGNVEVIVRNELGTSQIVNHLDRGDYYGELALLRDAPRNATCRATVPTEVLSVSRQGFDHLVRARFALREKVDRSLARAHLLRPMPLFAELDAPQIQLVAARLREEDYEPGAVIIHQGEVGESFYVIESGRVQVSVIQDGEERVIGERGPGEYVGEIALLLDVPRTATVTALTPVQVLVLHKDDFSQLAAKHLYVSHGLEREASRRMSDLRRLATSSPWEGAQKAE